MLTECSFIFPQIAPVLKSKLEYFNIGHPQRTTDESLNENCKFKSFNVSLATLQ